jgi:uncharacterized membrane protein YphA (DoxX/SURF4 family)
LAVAALVALRLGLGFHFLYEGVWKIVHSDKFTAEPFLTEAKGPISGLFYAMVPDIDGRERLKVVKDAKGKKSIDGKALETRWYDIQCDFVDYYCPAGSSDEKAKAAREKLKSDAEKIYKDILAKRDRYFKANVEDIAAYFAALDRFESDKEGHQGAPFQKKRRWDKMKELRAEAEVWIKELDEQEKAFKNGLYSLLDDQQKQRGQVPGSWNPLKWGRMEQINVLVTYSLAAIGLCLILGFFTPFAALGGAAFMCFVVMTQPAFPTIYPPDPAVVGHALLVNKDFVEMLALLVVSFTSAGRWAGLDFFLYRWIVNPIVTYIKNVP